MCTWNGWEKAGVANGAQGTVCDIIHGEGQGPPTSPIFVLVRRRSVKVEFIAALPMSL